MYYILAILLIYIVIQMATKAKENKPQQINWNKSTLNSEDKRAALIEKRPIKKEKYIRPKPIKKSAPILDPEQEQLQELMRLVDYRNPEHSKNEQIFDRVSAIVKLGEMGAIAAPAIPLLLRKVYDSTKELRNPAKGALLQIDENFPVHPLTLQQFRYLVKKLGHSEGRATSIGILEKMGEKASLPFINFIKDESVPDADKRTPINLLCKIRPIHPETIPLIISIAKSNKNSNVREYALNSLQELNLLNTELIQLLLDNINKTNVLHLREASLNTLGSFAEFVSYIESTNFKGDPKETMNKIIDCFSDDNLQIRNTAYKAIVNMGTKAIPYLLHIYFKQEGYKPEDIKDIFEDFDRLTKEKTDILYEQESKKRINVLWAVNEFITKLNRPKRLYIGIVNALSELKYDNWDQDRILYLDQEKE